MLKRSKFLIAGSIIIASLMTLSTQAKESPCMNEPEHAFDFWIGHWQVHTPEGKLAGINRIDAEYDGCVLHERYQTNHGYRGESLNIYDRGRKKWHQTWVDNTGLLLVLEGGLVEGNMVLEGEVVDKDGKITRHRITWSKNADSSVRQHWQTLNAQNEWHTEFDGRYTHLQE